MGNCIQGAFSSDTTISTPVAINKGGTGQTTAQAALDALAAASGSLVQGDIFIVDSSTNLVRLARGADNTTLMMNGSNPNWETVTASGGAWTKLGHDSGTSLDVDVADYEMYMVIGNCLNTTNGGKLQMQINSDGGANYDYEQGKKGSWSGVAGAGYIEISSSPAGAQMQNIFVGYFTQRQFSQDMHNYFVLDNPSVVGAASADYAIRCFGQHDESADISSFQITASSGSLHSSSEMSVYGLNLSA